VGFDGRLSSPSLSKALTRGLLRSGCNVVNLGMVPNPLLYYATHTSGIESGVMLTASHNPANYNGLKVVFKQACLAANQIQNIRIRVEENQLSQGDGVYSELDITHRYQADVCSKITLQRKLKLVIDWGLSPIWAIS
jgi:phosphomannomutase/phosphoglucomutase